MNQPPVPQRPAPVSPDGQPSALRRLAVASRPRGTRGQILGGLLCALLGFALVVQARSTQDQGLEDLRQADLVRILDDVTERSARLDAEAAQLRTTRDELASGGDQAAAALEAQREQLQTLGVLAGTLPAIGPGITLTIRDPGDQVRATVLLDALQELRDAGAEAVQLEDVRIVAGTAFVDTPEGIEVDGERLEAPYRFTAVGDPQTLAGALAIPGGVLAVLSEVGATGVVAQADEVAVDALQPLPTAEYARPAPGQTEQE